MLLGETAESVGVDVGVGDQFLFHGDLPVGHGVELVRGLQEKIEVMGDKDTRKVQPLQVDDQSISFHWISTIPRITDTIIMI